MKALSALLFRNVFFLLLLPLALASCRQEEATPTPYLFGKTIALNEIHNISFTADNGLLISGVRDGRYVITRTDDMFNTIWSRDRYAWGAIQERTSMGGIYLLKVAQSFQRPDGSFVCIVSVTEGGDLVTHYVLIIELDANGFEIARHRFDHTDVIRAARTDDGGYLLMGIALLRLDKDFHVLWSRRTYSIEYLGTQLRLTSGGGFAVTGRSTAEDYSSSNIFLDLFDIEGNPISRKSYAPGSGSPFDNCGFDVAELQDGGFLIAGREENISFNPYLLKTTADGSVEWSRSFHYPENAELDDILAMDNNGIIILGSFNARPEPQKSLLLKVSYSGEVLDSAVTRPILMLHPSPKGPYVAVSRLDPSHLSICEVKPEGLFQMK